MVLIRFHSKKDIILFTRLYFKYFNFKTKKLEGSFNLLYSLFRKVLNINSISNHVAKIYYLYLNFKFYLFVLESFKVKKFNASKIVKKSKASLLAYLKYTHFHLIYLYSNYYSVGKIKVVFKSHNIFFNVVDVFGNTLKLYSSGKIGFKGREKVTIIACRELSKICAKFTYGLFKFIEVEFLGKKGYTKTVIENIANSGLLISKISILDKAPHGGCRLKKKKRR